MGLWWSVLIFEIILFSDDFEVRFWDYDYVLTSSLAHAQWATIRTNTVYSVCKNTNTFLHMKCNSNIMGWWTEKQTLFSDKTEKNGIGFLQQEITVKSPVKLKNKMDFWIFKTDFRIFKTENAHVCISL